MPLFDTDPAAAMGLLRMSREVEIDARPENFFVYYIPPKGGGRSAVSESLEAAIAAAWLAAMEGRDG
jgi:hypothetical protein